MTTDQLTKAIVNKALSPDAIRDIAYRLESRLRSRSDAMAAMIGRRLTRGEITHDEAQFIVESENQLMNLVHEEVERFSVK